MDSCVPILVTLRRDYATTALGPLFQSMFAIAKMRNVFLFGFALFGGVVDCLNRDDGVDDDDDIRTHY